MLTAVHILLTAPKRSFVGLVISLLIFIYEKEMKTFLTK